ncbi:MAG: flagellar filament capping protein FliD [Oscillospiraceae bacterium]|nr:flagellar filament capping protein FliD [Oscillospiraceae bacterium]
MYGISSLGGSFNSFNWTSIQNDMKLQLIMNKSSTQKVSAISNLPSVSRKLGSSNAQFLRQYQSQMTNLMSKAGRLRGDAAGSGYTMASSDNSVVSVASSKNSGLQLEDLNVSVQQTAQKQTNVSQGYSTKSYAASLTGTLTLDSSKSNSPVRISLSSLSGRTYGEKLHSLADEINRYEAATGVTASVTEKDGKSYLTVSSSETGKDNTFSLSGSFAQESGLSNISQTAQNAVYTVKRADGTSAETYESASNTVQLAGGQVTAELKGAGSASLSSVRDTGITASAMKDLVSSYNQTIKFLNDNSGMGTGVKQQLNRLLRSPLSGTSMKAVGISQNKDGTLKFDEAAFEKSLSDNPDLTKEIISGNYSISESIYNNARHGMNISSAQLLNTSQSSNFYSSALESLKSTAEDNPYQFLQSYSRQGAYNLSNYNLVGLLINLNA